MKQTGFPRAGLTNNRDHLSAFNLNINLTKYLKPPTSDSITLVQVLSAHQRDARYLLADHRPLINDRSPLTTDLSTLLSDHRPLPTDHRLLTTDHRPLLSAPCFTHSVTPLPDDCAKPSTPDKGRPAG